MGAFFLHKKNATFPEDSVKNVFKEKGFSNSFYLDSYEWRLIYYSKQLSSTPQIYCDESYWLVICGTLIYRSENSTNCGKKLLDDLINESLDKNELLGSFAFLYFSPQNGLEVFGDAANIQNIYFDSEKSFWSSSFLAVQTALKKVSINKMAALENIVTGNVIGPDTLINEINRLEPFNSHREKNLRIQVIAQKKFNGYFRGSFNEAVKYQLEVLEEYFTQASLFANEQGIDSGLTSGFDSRLLLALVDKYWDNYQIHGHYRKLKDHELKISEQVAKTIGLTLNQVPVKHPLDMNSTELQSQMRKAYFFCDGLIRMHGYWTEEYNTGEHRKRVLGNKRLGISGIGGEQYRNMENLLLIPHSWRNFIKYHTALFLSGSCFKTKKVENDFIDYISTKAAKKIFLTNRDRVTTLEIKRYWNEVFIPARLGGRNNAENQVSHFLSPFSEHKVSIAAYEIIPYLGISNRFQMKMIDYLNPILAAAPSDYGYKFNSKIPLNYQIKSLVKSILPDFIKLKKIDYFTHNSQVSEWHAFSSQHNILKKYLTLVEDLELPIHLDKIILRPDLMPLVIQLGYTCNKL